MKIDKRAWKDAIAYRRVSTQEQGESGVGLEGQLAAIETYAGLDRFHIVNSFEDIGSGRGRRNLIDRPQLQAAIDVAKATGRPIIVSRLDRIARETKTINQIISDHGITVISAGEGKMRNPVIIASEAARAQREGELISQRTKQGLARKKAEGVLLGNRTNLAEARRIAVERKKAIAEQTVQEVMVVLDELADQTVTAGQLVVILNQRGILTSTKRHWTIPAIRRPLRTARQRIQDREARKANVRYQNHPYFARF